MVRIAPVRLSFNPKTLWFEAGDLELCPGQDVVVKTARGTEFGTMSQPVFDMPYEDTQKLKTPLKPVLRIATDEDRERAQEAWQKGIDALPRFKQLARETLEEMNPVSVEFMFEGDKAVFYFEAEERVDFRELVRKLASEFHVRVDMKQIGVRDEARMIGGLGHCGQELCCRRLGGEFSPVSIRMAKEQSLSLNPQKISGTCGRLMCCLRYEYDAYKDFHSRAPKKNAAIDTPEGKGKVVDLDVPREIVSIQVGDEKPVRIPLSDMDEAEQGARPTSVGEEAWAAAHAVGSIDLLTSDALFSTQLNADEKLAEPGKITRNKPSKGRSKKRSGSEQRSETQVVERKARRRRSTTVQSDGTSTVETVSDSDAKSSTTKKSAQSAETAQPTSRRRRSRGSNKQRTGNAQGAEANAQKQEQAKQPAKQKVQVGRNSSALRANKAKAQAANEGAGAGVAQTSAQRRRRRRSHRGTGDGTGNASGASAEQQE